VRRERSQEDRRVVSVSITAPGLELLARLDAPLLALHRSVLAHMTPAEVEQLTRLLEKARQGGAEEPAGE